jgi:hypothetical protein
MSEARAEQVERLWDLAVDRRIRKAECEKANSLSSEDLWHLLADAEALEAGAAALEAMPGKGEEEQLRSFHTPWMFTQEQLDDTAVLEAYREAWTRRMLKEEQ